jgi:hypothetical protein
MGPVMSSLPSDRHAAELTLLSVVNAKGRVQVYCWDEEGKPCPLDPKDVTATSHKGAAEALCGKGLREAGHHGQFAAKVWKSGEVKPDFKLFYRA